MMSKVDYIAVQDIWSMQYCKRGKSNAYMAGEWINNFENCLNTSFIVLRLHLLDGALFFKEKWSFG